MAALELHLRALAEHPRRRIIVTILTCGTLVMALWPAADEYFALCDFRAHLAESLDDARQEAAALPELEQKAARRAAELAVWENKTVGETDTHRFREELVELVRLSGCQMQRIDVGAPQRRAWAAGDDPLGEPRKDDKQRAASPYELSTRTLTLAVAGPLASVNTLVEGLRKLDKLLYVGSVSQRPADQERTEIAMELELLLLSLEKK